MITRNGLTVHYGIGSITVLYSYTADSYADALNTKDPSANGAVGIVPSYGLLDINSSLRLSERVSLKLNINNVTNEQYFTKRPSFYPGPGVWSSDGRSFTATASVKI